MAIECVVYERILELTNLKEEEWFISFQAGVIVPYIQKFKKQLIFAVAAIFIATVAATSLMASAAHGTTEVVTGDTSTGYGQQGWLFNRDTSTSTPYEFNNEEYSIGTGSLYVEPIGPTAADKFIGEYFTGNMLVSEFESLSYDFQIAGDGDASDANEFYTNVHANFLGSENSYGDCKYDYIPDTGTNDSFTNFSFDATTTPDRVRGATTCPATLADMEDGSTIFFFAINVGDTSANDTDLAGYYDNVELTKLGETTTFDFEPFVRTAEITSPEENATVMGSVDFSAVLHDDDADSIQWAVRQGTCAAGTNTVFGNVDSKNDVATINKDDLANQTFEFTGDMSGLENGLYCFIYNPREDIGEDNIRLTREFNLANPVVLGSKDECKNNGWATSDLPVFKNQGQCVSHFASNGNSTNARNR